MAKVFGMQRRAVFLVLSLLFSALIRLLMFASGSSNRLRVSTHQYDGAHLSFSLRKGSSIDSNSPNCRDLSLYLSNRSPFFKLELMKLGPIRMEPTYELTNAVLVHAVGPADDLCGDDGKPDADADLDTDDQNELDNDLE